jgi:uncharacterized membrane protein
MGGHHARPAAAEDRRLRRAVLAVVAPLALLTVVGLVWLWPTGGTASPAQSRADQLDARVTAVDLEPCEEPVEGAADRCGTATIEMQDDRGEVRAVEVDLPSGAGAPTVSPGDDVVVVALEGPDGETFTIVDQQRGTGMWVLAIAFVLALAAFGRWRGITALAGLVVTFVVLLLFVVPAVLGGEPPVLVAVVGAAAITLSVLYLTHGLSLSTTVAVVGTLASLALTGALAALSVAALHLSGITDDLSQSVERTYGVDMAGLLVASIVIGSLGVLDDVTVTQAATVAELAHANPAYRAADLFRSASRVGRSHIASVVNTIVLAYAGSSLPLLVLVVADNDSFADVLTAQFVAQEMVRSAVATLGLVAAVPLTTFLATLAVRRAPGPSDAVTTPGR